MSEVSFSAAIGSGCHLLVMFAGRIAVVTLKDLRRTCQGLLVIVSAAKLLAS